MTKRHTRMFFVGGTLLFAAIFVALTIDSHRQFDTLTNAHLITQDVSDGKDVWHKKNCINCHTLLGEGAYYAPDLTKITQVRGEAYLRAFLRDPSQFYSEEQHRRLMPNPNLSEAQITQVIAFLDWVSRIDNQGWPPRPILVTGATFPGSDVQSRPGVAASDDPVAMGELLYRQTPPGCQACHSTAPGVDLAGPNLASIATRAEQMIQDPAYTGSAEDAAGYIRESIVEPHAHLVPGAMYSADGRSFMPDNYPSQLTAEQIESLVAYLMSLR